MANSEISTSRNFNGNASNMGEVQMCRAAELEIIFISWRDVVFLQFENLKSNDYDVHSLSAKKI